MATDFGPHARLHDYSGASAEDLETDDNGRVRVSVPPMSYAVWGRGGIEGGFAPPARRTVQEFQLDDDLGDADPRSLRDGGRLHPGRYRTAGSIWAAPHSVIKIRVYREGERRILLRLHKPDARRQEPEQRQPYRLRLGVERSAALPGTDPRGLPPALGPTRGPGVSAPPGRTSRSSTRRPRSPTSSEGRCTAWEIKWTSAQVPGHAFPVAPRASPRARKVPRQAFQQRQ